MMKKIQVERIQHSQGSTKTTMSEPEFMLFAERVEELFLQKIEKRASNKNRNADEFEIITEWL